MTATDTTDTEAERLSDEHAASHAKADTAQIWALDARG